MKRAFALAAAVLSGCSSGMIPIPPQGTDVGTIEQKLSANSCIKSYKHWARNYFFASQPMHGLPLLALLKYDYGLIRFEYWNDGGMRQQEGRHLYSIDPLYGNYVDGHFRYATGSYDLQSHLLVVNFCGWNDRSTPNSIG